MSGLWLGQKTYERSDKSEGVSWHEDNLHSSRGSSEANNQSFGTQGLEGEAKLEETELDHIEEELNVPHEIPEDPCKHSTRDFAMSTCLMPRGWATTASHEDPPPTLITHLHCPFPTPTSAGPLIADA